MTAEGFGPGIYTAEEIPEDKYHADPVVGGSLSSSGARKLLPPSCPALFAYERDNPPARPSKSLNFGSAAHRMVLGVGPEIHVLQGKDAEEPEDRRKKAVQQEEAEAWAAGRLPVLRKEYEQIKAMADKLRQHPLAGILLDPDGGRAEQTIIWSSTVEGVSGDVEVMRRARLDWLPDRDPDFRTILVDYKTTTNASPKAISKTIAEYGYHQQAAWYIDAVKAVGAAEDDATLAFVFQEKRAPYLVTVAEIHPADLAYARRLNRQALETYARCTETGYWPGYPEQVVEVRLPRYSRPRRRSADPFELRSRVVTHRKEIA
ncbi:PD-(D/E)XK nuclease-like domain-containing protein [Saccharomonospora azurea]|uniref:PD-(D/E)XK nuclease-like domain-containing protein n=1 Tax=Saccharomonospora azurea TaxID=40988 RepID=UPI00331871F1